MNRGRVVICECRQGQPGNSVVNIVCDQARAQQFEASKDWKRTLHLRLTKPPGHKTDRDSTPHFVFPEFSKMKMKMYVMNKR